MSPLLSDAQPPGQPQSQFEQTVDDGIAVTQPAGQIVAREGCDAAAGAALLKGPGFESLVRSWQNAEPHELMHQDRPRQKMNEAEKSSLQRKQHDVGRGQASGSGKTAPKTARSAVGLTLRGHRATPERNIERKKHRA